MDSSSDPGLSETKCLFDVINNATALETCSVVPSSAPPENTSTPSFNGISTDIVITKKPPAKRAKKNPDTPAKPRAPRKKPINPPAPRSRAKPSATPPAVSFAPNDTQPNFLNSNYSVIQGGPQQSQQAIHRGTRVLLPKPASGQANLPFRPAGQNHPSNHVQFQNGSVVLGGGGQQQFMSFQNANGQVHFQSDRAPTQSPSQMGAAQSTGQSQMVMMNQTGGHNQTSSGVPTQLLQVGAQPSTGNVMYMGGQATSGATNQLIPVGGGQMMPTGLGANQTIRGPPVQGQPMVGPGSSMTQQAGQPGTVQVRLQVIQTANGPMTLAFFPDQGGSFNNMQSVGMPQFRPPITQQNQMQSNDGFIRNGMTTSTTPAFNYMSPPQQQQQMSRNFVSVSALAAQAQQQSSAYPNPQETKKEEPVEAEFNLEEFLMPGMFTTPSVPDANANSNESSAVTLQSSQQIMDELVSGPMFQSPVKSLINGPFDGQNLPPSVAIAQPEDLKKKRKRPTKKDIPGVKQGQTVEFKIISENRNLKKVEEILKSYAEEKNRTVSMESLPSGPFLLSSPPPSLPPVPISQNIVAPCSTAPTHVMVTAPAKPALPKVPKIPAQSVKLPTPAPPPVVVKQRSVTPPPPPPPPLPQRPKTDLALCHEKDEKFLEKLSAKPFKGINSAVNRLLPFHLLSTPDETLDILDRESRAFHHVAQALLDREKAIYSRFMEHLVSDAAEPICRLDMLSSSSTWLDIEREEFEAEKRAAADGATANTRPPVWVYNTHLNLEADIPYHDGNFLLGFTESVEDVPSPPPPLPPPVPDEEKPPVLAPPTVTVVVSPEAGRLKLRIKRVLPPSGAVLAATPEPPSKIRLKFKMSAKEGWVVGRTGCVSNTSEPTMVPDEQRQEPLADGPVEDVITRSAVDSILHVGESIGSVTSSKGPTKLVPVMMTNGLPSDLDETYFYGSGQFTEAPETDTALDEAINSILG